MERGKYITRIILGWALIVVPFVLDYLMLREDLANGAMLCTPPIIGTLTHPLWITCIVAGVVVLIVTHWQRKRNIEDETEE